MMVHYNFCRFLVISDTNLLKNCNFSVASYQFDLLHNLHRRKSGTQLLCGNLSVLYIFQIHIVFELSLKFGNAKPVCQMRGCIIVFIADLLY